MKPIYLGYSCDTVRVGDTVVSYPHNRTRCRLHGDVIAIDAAAGELRINYNRTERADSTMVERGCGVSTVRLATGAMFDNGVSTSLDVELILRSND